MTWLDLQKASEFIARYRRYNEALHRWEIDAHLLVLEVGLQSELEYRGWQYDSIGYLMYYDRGF